MSDKKYDIIIFGATGFTGKRVVKEVALTSNQVPDFKFAVAGRRIKALDEVLFETAEQLDMPDIADIDRLMADTSIYQSLLEMAQQTKIVLNCVGPYRFFGEEVVKACIEGGCSHIDISGEPAFLEKMQLYYNEKAREKGIYIIGACGWDSIPAEMGVIFTKSNFEGDLNSVESYIEMNSTESLTINFGTFQSAIHSFANAKELPALRKSLYSNSLPKPSHKLIPRGDFFWSDICKGYCITFPGSDKSIVYRTQRLNYDKKKERPIQFTPYEKISDSYMGMFLPFLFFLVFGVLAKFSFGRYLLETFPSFFSGGVFKKEGPTEKQIKCASFIMTFIGKGYKNKLAVEETHVDTPDQTVTVRVSGPEPGYVSTPIAMIQSAYTLLLEKDKIPKEGGVYTPGFAFAETKIIERLNERGLKFEVLK